MIPRATFGAAFRKHVESKEQINVLGVIQMAPIGVECCSSPKTTNRSTSKECFSIGMREYESQNLKDTERPSRVTVDGRMVYPAPSDAAKQVMPVVERCL